MLVTRHNSNNFYVSYSLDICVVNDKILKLEIDFCSNWAGPVELDSYKSSEIEAYESVIGSNSSGSTLFPKFG